MYRIVSIVFLQTFILFPLLSQVYFEFPALNSERAHTSCSIDKVYWNVKEHDMIGYSFRQNNAYEPLYAKESCSNDLREYLETLSSGDKSKVVSIRINDFFFSQDADPFYSRACVFELNCDFIVEQNGVLEIVYTYSDVIRCPNSNKHFAHNHLVTELFIKALECLEQELDTNQVEDLIVSSEMLYSSSTIRTALDISGKRFPDGVFWTFNDLCEGRIDTSFRPTIKKPLESNLFKLKFDERPDTDTLYAAVIQGLVYLVKNKTGSVISFNEDNISSSVYLSNPNDANISLFVTSLVVGGVLGSTIFVGTVGNLKNKYELDVIMNPRTGSFHSPNLESRKLLDEKVILYHSHYSSQDSIIVKFNEQLFNVKNYEVIEITISPNLRTNNLSVIAEKSELQIPLDENLWNNTNQIYVIKSKKGKAQAKPMKRSMFDTLKKEQLEIDQHPIY